MIVMCFFPSDLIIVVCEETRKTVLQIPEAESVQRPEALTCIDQICDGEIRLADKQK